MGNPTVIPGVSQQPKVGISATGNLKISIIFKKSVQRKKIYILLRSEYSLTDLEKTWNYPHVNWKLWKRQAGC